MVNYCKVVESMEATAFFDETKSRRYYLRKVWSAGDKVAAIVMCNPGKGVVIQNGHTVNRVINYLIDYKSVKFGSLVVVNMYATCCPKPSDLTREQKLRDEVNLSFIQNAVNEADVLIAAWGSNAGDASKDEDAAVLTILRDSSKDIYCFGVTPSTNKPVHPRYLKNGTDFVKYHLPI